MLGNYRIFRYNSRAEIIGDDSEDESDASGDSDDDEDDENEEGEEAGGEGPFYLST